MEDQAQHNKDFVYPSDLLTDQNIDDPNRNESQVFSYNADWLIYALGFSCNPNYKFRIGIGSFKEETENIVEIIQLNEQTGFFEKRVTFPHKYPPTKLMWLPDMSGTHEDILATTGETLKIWKINDNKEMVDFTELVNKSDFSAPLTSFDWNSENINLIGTSSIDTTCTIWDIEKMSVYTQLIAHDREVYDISFSPNANIFASVGSDGSARQFDLRNLEHSTVLYETENTIPLLRLAWNKQDPNYVAVIAMDQSYVTLLDMRHPLSPVSKLQNHKDSVNSLAWAPQSSCHLCTVGDDMQALIWDLSELKFELTEPLLEYRAEAELTNLSWSQLQHDWVAICYNKNLQILKVQS